MTDPDVLRDNVSGLIATFRQSLIALIPSADRSHLGWRDYEHPDWERLTAACYQAFVAGPISNDTHRMSDGFRLISYDIDPDDLSLASWIAPSESEAHLALVRLRSRNSPFDTAEFAEVSMSSLQIVSRDVLRPVECGYALVRRGPHGRQEITETVESND